MQAIPQSVKRQTGWAEALPDGSVANDKHEFAHYFSFIIYVCMYLCIRKYIHTYIYK